MQTAPAPTATGHLGPATRRRSTSAPFAVPSTATARRVADGLAQAPIAIGDRLVFVARKSGAVTALDADTGALVWSRKVMTKAAAAAPHEAGLLVSESSIWVRASEKLLELDTPSGEVKSRVACARLSLFDSVLVDGCIIATDHWGELGVVATKLRGGMRWHHAVDFTPDPLAASSDVVLIVDGGHTLAGRNVADGALRWQLAGRTQSAGPATSVAHALVASDELALAVVDRDIVALNLASGAVRWRVLLPDEPGAVPTVTATDEGDVFVVGRTRVERRSLSTGALAAHRGALAAHRDAPFGRSPSPFSVPCVTPHHLVCANMQGLVAVVTRDTLEVVWTAEVPSRRSFANWPVVAGGKIYVTSLDSALDVFD